MTLDEVQSRLPEGFTVARVGHVWRFEGRGHDLTVDARHSLRRRALLERAIDAVNEKAAELPKVSDEWGV